MGAAPSKPKLSLKHLDGLNTSGMLLSDSEGSEQADSPTLSIGSSNHFRAASVAERPRIVRRSHDRRSCYAEVDAGVPPPVPPHQVLSTGTKSGPKMAPKSPITRDSMSTEVYTRKSCYRRRQSTSSAKSFSESSGHTLSPMLSPEETTTEPSSPESLQFILDGYSESTKLRVVNLDDVLPTSPSISVARRTSESKNMDSSEATRSRKFVPSKASISEQAERNRTMIRRYSRYGHRPPSNCDKIPM